MDEGLKRLARQQRVVNIAGLSEEPYPTPWFGSMNRWNRDNRVSTGSHRSTAKYQMIPASLLEIVPARSHPSPSLQIPSSLPQNRPGSLWEILVLHDCHRKLPAASSPVEFGGYVDPRDSGMCRPIFHISYHNYCHCPALCCHSICSGHENAHAPRSQFQCDPADAPDLATVLIAGDWRDFEGWAGYLKPFPSLARPTSADRVQLGGSSSLDVLGV
jgi:hypothetical protein